MNDEKLINNDSPVNAEPTLPKKTAPDLPEQAKIMHLVDALLKTPHTLYNHVQRNDLQHHLAKLFLIFDFFFLCIGLRSYCRQFFR